ncbi:DUF4870 domain-containing protein [Chitinophaga pinensis]|uniref:DUF4870 domain-containing protein n=1 Tax=Chitinophaga pinensis (strain ATCC 43595 / DSM 2588 / LMG 13176 / NBRC 15968 / NCIMB 11800 / UQM 2034) TaxID=485918 RepID=A0A979G5E3_CHIPD|nr:DUF4870 domain-containing protein [Chitinophaga pinensis]ACU61139.1 conserved hypothetical protein [Chitinophaga pinensis DSM 2588]
MKQQEERNWALAMHLAGIAGMLFIPPAGNIIAALVLWLIKRNESEFLNETGKEALNFQITLSIINVGLNLIGMLNHWEWSWGRPGFNYYYWDLRHFSLFHGTRGIVMVVNIVFSAIAASKASNGIFYKYPLSWRLVK